MSKIRIEQDSFGALEVPAEAYYGVHSMRSRDNFDVAGERLPLSIVYGIVRLKRACATANQRLGVMPSDKAEAIRDACAQVLDGASDGDFVVDIFQAGSGTSSNMNINEVLANRAAERLGGKPGDRALVHPNDDVNQGQSTNNVFPSGIKVAAVLAVDPLLDAAEALAHALRGRAGKFRDVIKSGRTHLQDAVPVTVGQVFEAWARAVEKSIGRVSDSRDRCLELGIGGNAVGTGINTRAEFREEIITALNHDIAKNFRVAEDGLEITQFLTDLGDLSSALRLLALDINKIANDLRLLASGPNTGLGELALPPVEPGSSIMPGKINPSICEAANMACLQVLGNDAAVSAGVAAGQLELNTHMPLVGTNLMKSLGILERCCRMLTEKCVQGIEVHEAVCRRHFERSAGLATVLNPKLGYDRVAVLVKESLRSGKTMSELVLEQGILSKDELEALLRSSTGPTR